MKRTTKSKQDKSRIDGYPTKGLFIKMLVRDLTLRDAIGDLVDNSVDGAKSISENEDYQGFFINIIASPEKFVISDNCGGFSVDIARHYAFCFGRPDGHPETPGSIGKFGIGMKRALFKLGDNFSVESTTKNSYFKMDVDVEKWNKKKKNWDFQFTDYKENSKTEYPLKKIGTEIQVTNLRGESKAQFSDKNFIKKLRTEIELEHLYAILKGLKITINGHPLNQRNLDFLTNDSIQPGFKQYDFHDGTLTVKIYSGISSDDGSEGGWYIFCNDRLIIGPDTSRVTGWTGRTGDGVAEYHDQFHRFRGYVFFEAKNSELFPWNTTKTGMDMDSPTYKYVRSEMIQMMKPVMTLMNYLKKEKEGDTPEEERIYNNIVSSMKKTPLTSVIKIEQELPVKFVFPPPMPKRKKESKGKRILYYVSEEKFAEVKNSLGVKSAEDLGLKTFNYYYDMEIE